MSKTLAEELSEISESTEAKEEAARREKENLERLRLHNQRESGKEYALAVIADLPRVLRLTAQKTAKREHVVRDYMNFDYYSNPQGYQNYSGFMEVFEPWARSQGFSVESREYKFQGSDETPEIPCLKVIVKW